MIEKIKNTTPRPGTDKAAKFNRDARLVDLNRVIDDVNVEFAAVREEIDNLPTPPPAEVPTFQEVADASVISPFVPVQVNANFAYQSPSNSTTLNVQGIEQTGFAPGSAPFFIPEQVYAIDEEGFTDREGNLRGIPFDVTLSAAQISTIGTTQINLLPALSGGQYRSYKELILEYEPGTVGFTSPQIVIGGDFYSVISQGIIAGVARVYVKLTHSIDANDPGVALEIAINQPLFIGTVDGTDPTLGDGTLRIFGRYDIRTFGA